MGDENRRRLAVDRLIVAYRQHAEERGRELLQQHREWRERGSGRGAVSPLGGQAKSAGAAETQAAPKQDQPKKANWW